MAIWHIGTANKRIAELEGQLAAVTKERDEAAGAVSANTSEAVKAAEQLSADLETAKQTIGTLTKERDAAVASIASDAKQISDLQAQLVSKDKEVEVKVSQQAQSVIAQIGLQAPAIPEGTKTGTTTAKDRGLLQMCREELDRLGYQRKN